MKAPKAKPAKKPIKVKAKVKPKKKVSAKNKGGRPTDYRPEYAEQGYKLCLLGKKDSQLADFWGITETTLNNWKLKHPGFIESLKAGKESADSDVAASLYHRAKGYSHKAVKIFADAKTGSQHVVEYTEHYPPDPTACIFWLKNRQKAEWRDKTDIEHGGSIKITAEEMTDDELTAIAIGKK